MATDDFFDESTSQSIVKTNIVLKYFDAWSKIIIPQARKKGGKVGYIDLFSGPGYYEDGTESTPLLILKKAISNPELREMLVAIFNDKDSDNVQNLSNAIANIPEIKTLKYSPEIHSIEVGDKLLEKLESTKSIPSLIFIDPWGYKGVSLKLLSSLTKGWGQDCFFFFNFNRVNAAIDNPKVTSAMNALFGEKRANVLREKLKPLVPYERKLTIIEEISEALRESVGNYVLPFGFKNDRGTRTSHHLIFVSKHSVGYMIAKDIMARESSESNQGVPSFEYSPASEERQPLLFELSRPLDELGGMLLKEFTGKKLTMKEIYEQHNIGRPYIETNYKEVLRQLEAEGKIIADPPADRRKVNKGIVTFGDRVVVTFPE